MSFVSDSCIKDACYNKNKNDKKKKIFFEWVKNFHQENLENVDSFESFVKLLHTPICSSSIGAVRALFGLMMVIDIPDERGLGYIDLKYGDPMRCHFPLFDGLSPLPLEYMGLLYCIMWIGAFGIFLGLRFQISCLMFILPYWYIYLLDKTVWNNHSYLYGLVAILFLFTQANNSFSLDALLNYQIRSKPVPLWNYVIIRFQFFLLYFYAGVKKFDPDWVGGYSMSSLSLHWVFNPFRLVLNNEQIDFWIIHIFGFLFDLTVGFFLLIDITRPIAILFATAFHLMNSCMFHIGQFPYVCLVTTPIFCSYDWPEQFCKFFVFGKMNKIFGGFLKNILNEEDKVKHCKEPVKVTLKQKIAVYLLGTYVGIQLFLPYSHFITQGYNNWTNGLYGYSWDMMVQNWNSNMIVVKVVDNQSKKEFFLDPEAWVGNTRYSKHGDMLIQYAKCLKRNLNSPELRNLQDIQTEPFFTNISIYVDVWCSLNGRFQQRMFDPKQDLLTAEWNPFKKISWLMPLLSDLSPWRNHLSNLEKEIFNWSNYSDVLFVADFPGLHLENYINSDFSNISLIVLQGVVVLEQYNETKYSGAYNITLYKNDSAKIKAGMFHKVYTVSSEPSCYMYTYSNHSMELLSHNTKEKTNLSSLQKNNFFIDNLKIRVEKFLRSLYMLQICFNKLFFKAPIPNETIKTH